MYKLFFEDGSSFIGGEYYESKWNEIPNKPITRLEYRFNGKCLYAEGYSAYNHLVEHVKNVTQGIQYISQIIILLKNGQDILQVKYNPHSSQVHYEISKFGEEYRGKSTTGWKTGLFSDPQCRLDR